MAVWMELRCEGRTFNHDCPSTTDAGPIMDSFLGDHRSVREGFAQLTTEARGLGWRRTRDGWACPLCADDVIRRSREDASGPSARPAPLAREG